MIARRVLSVCLIAAVLLAVCLPVGAQVEAPEAGGTEEAAAEASAPAPPLRGRAGPVVPLYMNPVWLFVLMVVSAVWIYMTSWVYDDAVGVELQPELTSAVMLGAGTAGFVLTFLLHGAFAFLMLGLVLAVFTFYIISRNRIVPERYKFLGSHHRAELLRGIPLLSALAEREKTWRARETDIGLRNESDQLLESTVAEHPSLGEAADVLKDAVLQACTTHSREIRIFSPDHQYVVQHILDGVPRTVEALDPEMGKQIVGCASTFIGLGPPGRIRKGSAPMYAEMPGQEQIEIKVRVTSTNEQPALVLELPDWTAHIYRQGLETLGMHHALAERISSAVTRPEGALVFSSPPESGKTTTLYAAAGTMDIYTTDAICVEREPEHELEQIRRISVEDRPFSEVHAEVLREDPDAILFGQIKRAEEARALLEFADEHGKVMTTVEARTAPGALLLLAKMTDPELPARTVQCVTCQRLVRRLCPECREPVVPDPAFLRKIGVEPSEMGEWYRAGGCEECLYSGFRGRVGIFSMLIVTDAVRQALKRPDVDARIIKQAAGEAGFRTMYRDALTKVAAGVTALQEVRRVLLSDKGLRKEG